MIRQSGDGGGLDLLAVQRDDELLDLIGLRRGVAGDDEATRLLAALAAEIDDALPVRTTPTADPGSTQLPVADAPATVAGSARPGSPLPCCSVGRWP